MKPSERVSLDNRLPETYLEFLLRTERAFLNGSERSVPVFPFLCMAPDVEGFEEEPRSSSVLLNGMRVARVFWRDARVERTENYDDPQEIEPGSIVFMPWEPEPESEGA